MFPDEAHHCGTTSGYGERRDYRVVPPRVTWSLTCCHLDSLSYAHFVKKTGFSRSVELAENNASVHDGRTTKGFVRPEESESAAKFCQYFTGISLVSK